MSGSRAKAAIGADPGERGVKSAAEKGRHRYCPWCGRKAAGAKTVTVLKDGEMYD